MTNDWVAFGVAFLCVIVIVLYIVREMKYRAWYETENQYAKERWGKYPAIVPTECSWCRMPVLMLHAAYDAAIKRGEVILCDSCAVRNINTNPKEMKVHGGM